METQNYDFSVIFDLYAAAVEAAKNVGDMKTANVMFSAALNIAWQANDLNVAYIYIESDDDPNDPCNSYYDLIHLSSPAHDICIPSPLVFQDVAMSCYRNTDVVGRIEHARDVEDTEERRAALAEALAAVEEMEFETGSFRMPHWINPDEDEQSNPTLAADAE